MKTSISLPYIHATTSRLGGNLGENPNPKTSTKTEALKTQLRFLGFADLMRGKSHGGEHGEFTVGFYP